MYFASCLSVTDSLRRWATQPLRYVVPEYNGIHMTNIGHVYSDWVEVIGVTPQIFDVTIPGFLQVGTMNKTSPFPLATQLYTTEGTGSALVGSLYQSLVGLPTLDNQFLLEVRSKSTHFRAHSFLISFQNPTRKCIKRKHCSVELPIIDSRHVPS